MAQNVQNVIEKTAGHIADSAQQAASATGNMADAIDESTKVVGRVAQQGCDAAEEFVNDTKEFVSDSTRFAHQNLWQTIAATLIAGVVIGWMMKRQ